MLISNNPYILNTYSHSPTLNKKTFLVKDGKVTREGWKFLNNSSGNDGRKNDNQNSKQNNKKGEK